MHLSRDCMLHLCLIDRMYIRRQTDRQTDREREREREREKDVYTCDFASTAQKIKQQKHCMHAVWKIESKS